jgi:hypothetical protein
MDPWEDLNLRLNSEEPWCEEVPFCPVFYPSEEEFKNFSSYVEYCVKQVGDIGIFKVSNL